MSLFICILIFSDAKYKSLTTLLGFKLKRQVSQVLLRTVLLRLQREEGIHNLCIFSLIVSMNVNVCMVLFADENVQSTSFLGGEVLPYS